MMNKMDMFIQQIVLLETLCECGYVRSYFDTDENICVYDSPFIHNVFCILEEFCHDLKKGNFRKAEQELKDKLVAELKLDKDLKVSRKEFLQLYDAELIKSGMGLDSDVYGNDVTVHWNGFYCTCEDGATAWNYIIKGVEDVMDELDDEEN